VKAQYHLPQPVGVSIGNPHAVCFMDYTPNDETLTKMGRAIEHHKTFPDRTNVEFAALQDDGTIRMRVWERSAGITQACGSAACATAAAAIALKHRAFGDDIVLKLDGGDLTLNWPSQDKGMLMTGVVTESFRGTLDLSLFT
jgi:diaminopimelate epimerase